jgi:hypothetical protein
MAGEDFTGIADHRAEFVAIEFNATLPNPPMAEEDWAAQCRFHKYRDEQYRRYQQQKSNRCEY